MKKPPKPPTDLEIMEKVYERYYDTFVKWKQGDKSRRTKNYVPIDLQQIADDLGVDGDIIHGRFYSFFAAKYGVERGGEVVIPFFQNKMDDQMHVVAFSVLTSELAELMEQDRKHSQGVRLALGSLAIAAAALAISLLTAFGESRASGVSDSATVETTVEDGLPVTD